MSLFNFQKCFLFILKILVVKENCNQCLKCVEVCRTKSLEVINGKVVFTNTDNKCNKCYHCFSICPVQAIQIEGQSNELTNKFVEQLKQRRSIRNFEQEKIDDQTLQKLDWIKQFAPSACNRRPIKTKILCLLDNPEFEQKVVEMTQYKNQERVFRTAPYLYFTYVDETGLEFRYLPIEDSYITTEQLDLYLNSINLGGFWCGLLTMYMDKIKELDKYVKQTLQLPENYTILSCYGFGKPKIQYERPIQREDIKVTFI